MSKFDKTVCLYYTNITHRGPGKVASNLTKGLKRLGVTVSANNPKMPGEYHGVLQPIAPTTLNKLQENKKSVLMGPNLFVLPADAPGLCSKFEHFVVPSLWVEKIYKEFDEMNGKSLHIWPVGIETDIWKPGRPKSEDLDCFIYFKNRSEQDLRLVEALCRKHNLKYKVIMYGSYQEEELSQACQNSEFVILLTGTESQGVGYMQILSTDTPCYVFNNPKWKSDDSMVECPASSVPYFDKRCGYTNNGLEIDHFSEFISKLGTFSPRKYILENHTLEKSAEHYLNLLKKTSGEG